MTLPVRHIPPSAVLLFFICFSTITLQFSAIVSGVSTTMGPPTTSTEATTTDKTSTAGTTTTTQQTTTNGTTADMTTTTAQPTTSEAISSSTADTTTADTTTSEQTTEQQATSTTAQITTDVEDTTDEQTTDIVSTTVAQTTPEGTTVEQTTEPTTVEQTTEVTTFEQTTDVGSTQTVTQTTDATTLEQTTDVSSTPTVTQTTEATTVEQTTDVSSTPTVTQTTEATTVEQTTDVSSTPTVTQTTEATTVEQTTDVSSTPTVTQTTEATTVEQTTDVSSTPTVTQTTEATTVEQTTDVSSTPTVTQTTEATTVDQTTDVSSTPTVTQTTEATTVEQTTDVSSTPTVTQTTEATTVEQTTPVSSTPTVTQTTEATTVEQTTDASSTPTVTQTTDATTVQQTTDVESTPTVTQTTEATTAQQTTDVGSTQTVTQTTDVTTVEQTTDVSSTPTVTQTTDATTVEQTTDVGSTITGPQTTAATTVEQTTDVSSTPTAAQTTEATTVEQTTYVSSTLTATQTTETTTVEQTTDIGSTQTVTQTTETTAGRSTTVNATDGPVTTDAGTTIVSPTTVTETTLRQTSTTVETTTSIVTDTTLPDTTSTNPKSSDATTSTNPPSTVAPTTAEPTSVAPTTAEPTSVAPTTAEPTSVAPTTAEPTSVAPTTAEPTSVAPTTAEPTSVAPTTAEPTSMAPTTAEPTSVAPTTAEPTSVAPTTAQPTSVAPTTAQPTTVAPTSVAPTTAEPSTVAPTTVEPTTVAPTTEAPTTAEPSTAEPTTVAPTTNVPTTVAPTTAEPSTESPTTAEPSTVPPTTAAPTTAEPSTVAPTTVAPTTVAPTTVAPTTVAPTTVAPTTVAPTTVAPTTVAPTTVAPTTVAPTTVAPTTVAPTTVAPTTDAPTLASGIYMEYGTQAEDSFMSGTDDGCDAVIDTAFNIPFRGQNFRKIYICANGIVCFNRRYQSYSIPRNGDSVSSSRNVNCLAPYFADINLESSGRVWYQGLDVTSDSVSDTNNVVVGVKTLINETYGIMFNPVYIIKATWEQSPRFGGNAAEVVTFQVVYATDGQNAYSFYFYGPGEMSFLSGSQFIGLLVNGRAEGFDDSLDGSYLRRADDNLSFGTRKGAASFEVTTGQEDQVSDPRITCKAWHKKEKTKASLYRAQLDKMPLCPCTLTFLFFDSQFSFRYLTIGDWTITVPLLPRSDYAPYGKTCVYSLWTGSFISSGSSAGSFSSYNEVLDPRQNELNDVMYKDICCSQSDLCELYYDVRPTHSCYSVFPFSFSRGFGDPHIATLDGRTYTFNGHGEYILMKISTSNFEIQSRTDRADKSDGTESEATIFTGFAVQTTDAWLQVEINFNKTGINLFAGVSKTSWSDYTTDFYNDGNSFSVVNEKYSLTRDNKTLVTSFSDTGIAFNVTVGVGLLQMSMGLKNEFRTKTTGLLGNFNNDNTDDLIPRSSAVPLSNAATEREIFRDFGQTWLTSSSESIFKYNNGKSHADHSFPDFVPKFLDEANQTVVAEAISRCGEGNNQCIFDYVFTGNEELASETTATEQQAAADTADAANAAPSVSMNSGTTLVDGRNYFYTTLNEQNTFTLLGTDDGTLTYEFVNTTADATLGTVNADGTIVVDVTVSDLNPVYVSVTATDDRGVKAPPVEVVVVLCTGCNSHGTCNNSVIRESASATDSFKYATCVCEPYWTGDDCELDFDGCEDEPCSVNRTCTDTNADTHKATPTLKAYSCSACPDGYQDVNDKCEDVNECSGSSGCTQSCVNTEGSFYCQCNNGYRLASDGVTCNDINECEESTSGCDQVCTNQPGSFQCSCFTGFTYNSGTNTCEKDLVEPTGCDALDCSGADGCTLNETGEAVCFCNTGFLLLDDNSCQNIDECTTGVCSQSCSDTVGSFTCSCYTGYRLLDDQISCEACAFPNYGVNCASTCQCGRGSAGCDPVSGCICKAGWTGSNCDVDIDECLTPNVCGNVNKVCTNTVGSYTCSCRSGYRSVNGTCTDIDECSDPALNVCDQLCTNTIGGFSCSCRTGYNIDPSDSNKCIDFDECTAGVSDCEQICVNSEGRFSCECYFGFLLKEDRKTCQKLEDPCVLFPDTTCSDICLVINEAAKCFCRSGFVLGADGQTCIDVNECDPSLNLNLCSDPDTCVNSAGNYECSCNPGFKLENDLRTCTADGVGKHCDKGRNCSCGKCDSFHYGVNCANDCNCGVGATRCDSVTGCVCEAGWTGAKCDVDRDECATSPCTKDQEECINTPGSYMCSCQQGFTRDVNENCTDVDECSSTGLNDCSQECTNTVGSYVCSCNAGFTQDGNLCNDINECEGQNECTQICSNMVGSYRCSCNEGFKLDLTDRKTCIPAEQCDASANPCDANTDCAVVNSLETCSCKAGYQFASGSSTRCEDIQECSQIPNPCSSQNCTELPGSYECSCDIGYRLDIDQTTCVVCPDGTFGNNCLKNCSCDTQNTLSCDTTTGDCNCKEGWEEGDCDVDINECNDNTSCPNNSQCNNSPGSFSCDCDIGFSKSGDGSCQACDSTKWGDNCANECTCKAENTAFCDAVSGACTCNIGWNTTTCETDVDECENSSICGDVLKECQNTQGSYTCSCISGYTINNLGACIDDDECLLGTSTCKFTCTNTPGSFNCSCPAGYTGTENNCIVCAAGEWGEQCVNECNCNSTYTSVCDPAKGCVCKSGWTGVNCSQDIDECTDGTNTCPADSTCNNTPGSFECPCNIGYKSESNACLKCLNNTYGVECANTCDCVAANAIVESQSCNYITGVCECRETWNGTRCETDVDECAIGTSNCDSIPNRGCHNTIGGFECSCFIGYETATNGSCVPVSVATTSSPGTEVTVKMSIRLNYNLSESTDIRVAATFEFYATEVRIGLLEFFRATMGDNIRDIVAESLEIGSIVANISILMPSTDTAAKQFSSSTLDLATGGTVSILGTPTQVQQLFVGQSNVDLSSSSEKQVLCATYFSAQGQCASDEECVIADGNPRCQPLTKSDNFGLVIGLGVGVPLFLVACLIIAIVIIYTLRNRRKKQRHHTEEFDRGSFNNGFFPHTIPTKISTWGRNNPVARLYGPRTWEDESASGSTDDGGKHRRPRRDFEVIRPEEAFSYDNVQTSNFSWDFLYNYLQPHERYEIARPQHEQHPHPVFTQ